MSLGIASSGTGVSFNLCCLRKQMQNLTLGSMPLGAQAEFDIQVEAMYSGQCSPSPTHCKRQALHALFVPSLSTFLRL